MRAVRPIRPAHFLDPGAGLFECRNVGTTFPPLRPEHITCTATMKVMLLLTTPRPIEFPVHFASRYATGSGPHGKTRIPS